LFAQGPLTINQGGVYANGPINISALSVADNDSIIIDGTVRSTSGSYIILLADGDMVVNGLVSAVATDGSAAVGDITAYSLNDYSIYGNGTIQGAEVELGLLGFGSIEGLTVDASIAATLFANNGSITGVSVNSGG